MDPQSWNKNRLRQRFNAAANGYDQAAELQRVVADRLLEQLQVFTIAPLRMLDLGSGTGYIAHAIEKNFRKTKILQLDHAHSMLMKSRSSSARFFSRQSYLCADAEMLPLADASVDVVISNLMLQWAVDLDEVFRECQRILKPEGLFLFTSFGPDTLCELRDSWATVDNFVHVNTFIDMHDVGDGLIRAGFTDPVLQTEPMTLLYESVYALMHELRALGANNSNPQARKTLTGKGQLDNMIAAYDARYKDNERIPASFEVVYGHAWANSMHRTDGEVHIPVAAIGRREHDAG